ncbi:DUF4738 domain-containing protein [Pararhodonellum marinum]|uniref:DUF4738 domain-containing protein n=1 Tax=Pararhodonellum marinum TaxID=2755358 RepID=UPI00189061CC|nr:DUF4738 domain-containing protein [Pararhodonellum marinum]
MRLEIGIVFLFVTISCGGKENVEGNDLIQDSSLKKETSYQLTDLKELYLESVKTYNSTKKNDVISSPPIFFDTLINQVRIQTILRDTKHTIVRGGISNQNLITYFDTELILFLAKKDKIIHDKKVIKKTDFLEFVYESDLEKYSITNSSFEKLTSEETNLTVMICQPDTDICFRILLVLKYDGTIEYVDLDE